MADQKIWFYPTPSEAYTAKYTYRRRLYDFDNASDNPDFPQTYALPLEKILAAEMAPFYHLPLEERMLINAESDKALAIMLGANKNDYNVPTIKSDFF